MRALRRRLASPTTSTCACPLGCKLAEVFRLETRRVVANDWVVRYRNRLLQLERQSPLPPARSTVLVCEDAAGAVTIRYRDALVRWTELTGLARGQGRRHRRPHRPSHRRAPRARAHRGARAPIIRGAATRKAVATLAA